jgi:hypothetical protein
MNSFVPEWLPACEQELARILMFADDPQAVTAASAEIDRLLSGNPLGVGQAMPEGLFKLTVHPLTVFFSVNSTQRTVEVSWVWYTP